MVCKKNDETVVSVALPRNLLGGFCKIKPLIEYGDLLKKKQKFPEADNFIKALLLVTRFFCHNRWDQILRHRAGESELTFEIIDSNHDGVIDKKELKALLEKVLKRKCSDLIVDEMMDSIDQDHNGVIDHDEFDILLARLKRVDRQ